MTDVLNPKPEETIPVSFTAHDRCDRCGAQAKGRATMETGDDLLFCNHHLNEYEAVLVTQGARIERGPEDYAGTPGAST